MISNTLTFKLPRIYPITDRDLTQMSHAEQVTRLIDGGATLIQLRDKVSSPKEFLRQAEAALLVARRSNVSLIINDRVDVAMVVGADGVHVGQSDIPPEVARRLMGPKAIIGFSTHNAAQLKSASQLPVDYLAFGPIFQTGTKRDHEPVAGRADLRSARAIAGNIPLVAIGGITLTNAQEVFEAGADSVAVIGALLSDPVKISQNLRRMLGEFSEKP